MSDVLKPGSTIGILGGGQLGRMLAMAGARLGFDVAILDPESDCPAGRVAARTVTVDYDDLDAVAEFAASVDAITYEFENVPVEAAKRAAKHAPLRPGWRALEVAQDRLAEKTFLNERGARTVNFKPVDDAEGAARAEDWIGSPAILKTRRFGYDGKGQAVVRSAEEARTAFERLDAPCILEAFADFEREVSVVAARGLDGTIRAWPISENVHASGILRETTAPAPRAAELAPEALRIATAILEGLDYVGVLAVELFAMKDGSLLVNEIAPRVHNTGHWTMDACACGQFEQHMRAVAGWPLGDPAPHSSARMINLIGEDAHGWADHLGPASVLHLYGKREARPGRKMGHVNVLGALEA